MADMTRSLADFLANHAMDVGRPRIAWMIWCDTEQLNTTLE